MSSQNRSAIEIIHNNRQTKSCLVIKYAVLMLKTETQLCTIDESKI